MADVLYSRDFVCHFIDDVLDLLMPVGERGSMAQDSALDAIESRPLDSTAEGDRVVIRITSTGTQLGEFAGIAPTGKKITIEEFHIFRLAGGKIVEQWGMPDVQGLMAQLNASSVDKKRIP